ncbi:MAG TPA: PLP-dependent aspartate aminotransferase family protein [Pyrinomonadaceae bacterium]|jgi:cystathionine gamma-synthase/methionine-gamma-lyase|nr:PLP-dependent aspartate aminotransferase family protein [Pyrinomonadaceae bacterium]
MNDESKKLDINTKLVHAGERQPLPGGTPSSTPIYATSTFTYPSMEEIDKVFSGEQQGYVYTRHGNPTLAALEQALLAIEEGATACVYASGMAALHAALLACDLRSGSTVLVSQDVYGATTNLLFTVLSSFGVKTVATDFSDIDGLREKVREVKPQVMVAETISNPLLKICDIEAVAEIARENNARLIIDNTFASPYLCQPLKLGADLVVHSATKYLGGHADATGGVVVSRDEMDSNALIGAMKLVGGVLSVWDAHMILRGVKTLALRMERQCDNARRLAEHLIGNSRLERVHYPAPTPDAGIDLTRRILRAPHGGALVSIELKEQTREAAFRFMDALQLCVRSTSLGDVFTSVLHAASASHRDLTPARRAELGITEGLVRISLGIESIDDIIADVEQAL